LQPRLDTPVPASALLLSGCEVLASSGLQASGRGTLASGLGAVGMQTWYVLQVPTLQAAPPAQVPLTLST